MRNNLAAVILASGLSERMGTPKALLKWDSSATFIEKLIGECLSAGCDKVICTINELIQPFCEDLVLPAEVKFIVNQNPQWGRFYSVKRGLSEVSDFKYCFIHNVDNPFIDKELMKLLYSERDNKAWCSPVFENRGGHPVLLPSSVIREILVHEEITTTLSEILCRHPQKDVCIDSDLVLRNINNPEDYKKYFCR